MPAAPGSESEERPFVVDDEEFVDLDEQPSADGDDDSGAGESADLRRRKLRARREALARVDVRRSRQWSAIVLLVSLGLAVQLGYMAWRDGSEAGAGVAALYGGLCAGMLVIAALAFRTWRVLRRR